MFSVCILTSCSSLPLVSTDSLRGCHPDVKIHSTSTAIWNISPGLVQKDSRYPRQGTEDGESGTELKDSILAEISLERREYLSANQKKTQDIKLVAALKDCTVRKDLVRGSIIHADIIRKGLLETNVFVGSSLINLYIKCSALERAQHVFEELSVRDAVSWNALIAGYAHYGQGAKALECFERMQNEGFFPTEVSYACSLKACAITEDIDRGFELHAQIVNDCQLEEHIIIANALVDMYSKCHRLLEAQEVFDELQNRDVVTWNAIIAGYAQHERGREALNCFEHMQISGFSPDANTLPSILKACTSIGALDEGMEIHSQFVKEHLLVKEPHIGTALVDMYAKCGDLQKAQEVFDKLPIRDAVLWNALISGYSQHNCGDEAIKCFHLMLTDGFSPCASTFACMLAVCGGIKALGKGQEFHAFIVTDSCVENDVYVGTALVDMYAKCGALEEAQAVFDELGTLNVASWNALIGGYVQSGFGDEAFMLFESMYRERFSPDTITFAHMLKACGNIGALQRGQSVHTQIVSHGLSLSCEVVGNALLDMYANCGMLAEAWMMFNKLPVQDVVSWSALMVGLSQLGKDEIVFDLFYKMIATGLQPDSVMFSVVLNACSHNGLLEKGEAFFKMITKVHGKIPDVEHYTCMLDLFGRIGHLEMVMAIIKEMPFPVTATVWHIFLGACRLCGHFKLGKWAFEFAVLDDEDVDAAYVSMGDLYTVSE